VLTFILNNQPLKFTGKEAVLAYSAMIKFRISPSYFSVQFSCNLRECNVLGESPFYKNERIDVFGYDSYKDMCSNEYDITCLGKSAFYFVTGNIA